MALINTILLLGMLSLEMINWKMFYHKVVIEEKWAENISLSCGERKLKRAFGARSMVYTGVLGLGFGAFYGILAQHAMFKGMTRYSSSKVKPYAKFICRLIVALIIASPSGLLHIKLDSDKNDIFLLFKSLIPCLTSTGFSFFISDEVSFRLGLYDENVKNKSNEYESEDEMTSQEEIVEKAELELEMRKIDNEFTDSN